LNNVNIQVKQGEIHCLVGENGAGKSTLMKVLSGVYPYGSYSGEIIFNGEIMNFSNISDSENVGIAIIYQELALVPELSIYENIFLGHEIKSGFLKTVDWNETVIRAKAELLKVKLNINPDVKVKELGIGKQQLVEITKALSKNVKLLILDEPTAALNEGDSENLLNLLIELKNQGVTSIMISHKLKEVLAIADTITVLRDGQTICSLDCKGTNVTESMIIKNMVGREIADIYPKRKSVDIGEVNLEVKNWNAFDKTNRHVLKDINLNVRKGEIIGISGLMGSGRTEFALSIFGNSTDYKISGETFIEGNEVLLKTPYHAIKSGIAYVSEDRKGNGLILINDIIENISIANLKKISKYGVLNKSVEIINAEKFRNALKIKTPSIEQIVGNLSGGNQQKVSLSKWLFTNPNVLILDEPTRGIDVGAKFEIYTIMNELVKQGMSIIMISSELSEILGMSDRVYVMSEGKITGELAIKEANQEKIMELATIGGH
jgi:putative multiple sugar transport system ATP-binding protein